MAEKFAFDIAVKVLSGLGPISIQQIGSEWGVEEELEKLKVTVSTIKNVLLVAQEKQKSDNLVKAWLQELKDILCDADDLLDEVATETKKRELVSKVRYFFTSSNPVLFRHNVGSKIKDIQKRLDHISSLIGRFGFIMNLVERPIETIRREETIFRVNTQTIIGRGDDKKAIVDLLLSFDNQENVLTIPIVGLGGLGKTTLAQLVYCDVRIRDHFPQSLWVSVSTDFDIKGILIKILQAGGGCDDRFSNNGLQELQKRVTSMLGTRKFLLFLDDVWNEDVGEWNRLVDLLITGASGSRIVVTTRSTRVASILTTIIGEPYRLRGLSEGECLALLVRSAFREGEENMHENLVNIGREIVKKCGGVPLAVMTLGRLLSSKRSERDWLSVRDNDMWACAQGKNDILPLLRLSYDQMPSHLQQCFAYCSLFERDKIIDGKKLLYAWMAQGFVQRLDGIGELEDIGESYIVELVNRFFLEPHDGGKNYKMTGLVHSLAQDVAGNECLTIKRASADAIPRTLRHVAVDSDTYSEFPKDFKEVKKLRTIFYRSEKNPPFGSETTSFRCLRACEDRIASLKEIRKLKLLRYLSLKRVEKLPKSLCELLNLLYLDLSLSGTLELPKDFKKLINLEFLCLSTKLERLPTKGIGMLKSLRTLIISECEALRSLDDEIGQLSCLRELALESCSKLRFLPAGFRNLTSLERLEISSCLKLKLSNDDDLRGLKSLNQLKLKSLPHLVSLPMGLLDAAGKLTHLEIESCEDFTSPSESVLPNLKSLKSLKIWDCGKVDSLPEGMRGLRLQSLSIVDCPVFTAAYDKGAAESRKIAHVPKKVVS